MAITASSVRNLDDHNVTSFPNNVKPYSDTNHDDDDDYNNHARARAYAYERARREIDEVYLDVFNRSLPAFVRREVEWFLGRGMQPQMIRCVIEYTACAPRPSWAYARAVLYRSMDKHIMTEDEFNRNLESRGRDGCEVLPY